MRTPLGAMLRAICRQGSGFGMMVLEVGFGLAVVAQCLALSAWFVDRTTLDPGIPTDDILVITVAGDAGDTPRATEDPQRLRAAEEHQRLRALPGVVGVSLVERPPFETPEPHTALSTELGTQASAWLLRATDEIDEAIGLQILAGRGLRPADLEAGGVLVSASLADTLFPGLDPLGRAVRQREDGRPLTVVGVFADVTLTSGMVPVRAHVLVRPLSLTSPWRSHRWLARTHGAAPARAQVEAALAPLGLHVLALGTLGELRGELNRSIIAAQLVLLVVVKVVASVTLLGSLGMAAFLVHARRRQVAIMRALGATKADVTRYFLMENFLVTTLGVLLGVGLSFGLHAVAVRFEPTLELSVRDIALGALMFWVVGLVAAWSPAIAAARIAPAGIR
jgi:putative ABC transport system permease protein